jgi:UDP-N-acetylmuramate--alanine ligase
MKFLGRTRRVHFVGIGGIGMSGIAELVANLGYAVSGSDARRSEITDRLAALGVAIAIGHAAENIGDADVVVVSSAIAAENPEIQAARARKVPVIARAEMLAELMRLRFSIAVAGAHGKTTTTSMVALMLERGGLDPTAVIGGRLSAFGSNARLGRSEFMVAEADESDRSFLKLSPAIAVVTNIDHEHMEAYGSFDRLVEAFRDFADRVPFYGAVVACLDNPAVAALVPRLRRRVITYGFAPGADVSGDAPSTDGHSATCRVRYTIRGLSEGTGSGDLTLQVPGEPNLQNALAATAVGLEVGLPFDRIASALAEFRGAERRYQKRGTQAGITVVDDYGHHPTEVAAVLRAARAGRPSRLVAVFQPHRHSRTRDLLEDFGPALALADVVVLTDIYAAGEPAIPGITIETLAAAVRRSVSDLRVVPVLDDVPSVVASLARAGDLVLTLGAGSIGSIGDRILARLAERAGGLTGPEPRASSAAERAPGRSVIS